MPIPILGRTRPSLRWERISVSHSIATAASPTAANDVGSWPRLCEKSHRQKKRRIVFFVVFCDGSCLHCSFSNPTKSRRKFQIKIELPTFHTAWKSGTRRRTACDSNGDHNAQVSHHCPRLRGPRSRDRTGRGEVCHSEQGELQLG